jgi:hypothetical protein
MRIAQLVVAPVARVILEEAESLTGKGARRGRIWFDGRLKKPVLKEGHHS